MRNRQDVNEKTRPDLIPPYGLLRLGDRLRDGIEAHGERNYEEGEPVSHCLARAMRHLLQYLAGMRDEDHLASSAHNVLQAMETQERVKWGLLPANLEDTVGGKFEDLDVDDLQCEHHMQIHYPSEEGNETRCLNCGEKL